MSYMVKKNEIGTFDLFDKGSEEMIELHLDEHTARTLCRKMNLGSGFGGWTPSFFAKKYSGIHEEA